MLLIFNYSCCDICRDFTDEINLDHVDALRASLSWKSTYSHQNTVYISFIYHVLCSCLIKFITTSSLLLGPRFNSFPVKLDNILTWVESLIRSACKCSKLNWNRTCMGLSQSNISGLLECRQCKIVFFASFFLTIALKFNIRFRSGEVSWTIVRARRKQIRQSLRHIHVLFSGRLKLSTKGDEKSLSYVENTYGRQWARHQSNPPLKHPLLS